MEKEESNANGEPEKVNDGSGKQTDIKVRDADAVLRKNQELVANIAKVKKEKEKLASELSEQNKKRLEAEGNKDKLIEEYRKEIDDLKGKFSGAIGGFVDRVINEAFVSKAKDLGVDKEYVGILYNEFNNSEVHRDQVLNAVDRDTFAVESSSFDDFFASAKEKYARLFDKKKVNIEDVVPSNGKPESKRKKKTESDLLEDYMKSKGWR